MSPWSVADLLPGLVAAAGAGLATVVLHRFYDRVPAVAVVAFSAVVAGLLWPVLVGGRALLPLDSLRGQPPFLGLPPTDPHGNPLQGDLILLVAPAAAEVRRAVAAGGWPLWSPHAGAGMPLMADPQAQALQPLAWPALLLGVVPGAGTVAALRLYGAQLFTFLFLRRQGLGVGASAAGALAWGLGGPMMLWLGWPLANSAAWLPAALYAAARVADRGGRRDALLLATAAAGLLTAGHPETILYAALLAGAFFLHRLLGVPADRGRRLATAAGAVALAVAVAAPALLPAAAYLPQSLRARRLAEGAEPAAPPPAGIRMARRLLPLAAPNTFGNDRYAAYWGEANVNEDASGFVGSAVLLLAALAGAGLGRGGRLPGERLMAAAAGVCLVVVALPPGLPALLARLPGGTASGYHHRLLLPLSFGLVVLAACELERWARAGGGRWAPPLAAAALAAVVLWAYAAFPHPQDPERLDVLRRGWVHWHLRFLGAAALLLAVARGRRLLPYGIAALVAAELLLLHAPANPPMPRRLAFPTTEPLARLAGELAGPEGYRFAGLDGAMPPNLGAVYGLADVRVYSPMAPAAYLEALAPVIVGWTGETPVLGHAGHPLYARLGVRTLLAPPGREPPPGVEVILRHPAGDVWLRPDARPRLFLSAAAAAAATGRRTAGPEAGRLAVEELGAARVTARIRAPEAGLLATSIYQDGGWRLLVDGRRLPVTPAGGPFVAGRIPAGDHTVALLYRPAAFLLGCLAAACGLALGGAWLVPPPAGR